MHKLNTDPTNPINGMVMGFDFGMKRIGIALGQTVTLTANPLQTIAAKEGAPNWEELSKILKKWQPNALVVGIPLNMDGSEQKISASARQFATELQKRFSLPVFETDERLTTKDAKERLFAEGGFKALQDGQVDAVAAQLILQNWLQEQNNISSKNE